MDDLSGQHIYVSDTVAVILWLEERKLPQRVKNVFISALAEPDNHTVWIPAMALAEVGYLHEKGRIETSPADVLTFIQSSPNAIKLHPMDADVILKAFKINDVPELHDRLIAGTASLLDAPILTNDPDMELSEFVKTIWK